ncbi:hypothetical protein GCM10010168_45100 [Actinoplanes ianthinogenes]|uniref:Lipoprotein n=1 Tax=Actinoplanes ianthinogenes TaxID=122358 RepID=A0ABM7LPM4_9ACTN|nr:hypothetical protein [Actinoplanes ianthinogenes]BCJ41192.1 hypothetical protein Aiant_18490 [Actinoplanes ianthinogenes]GGR22303.1 hypothetical protein GCM10010168_45100 [Actinoplanes ianthinogenes]
MLRAAALLLLVTALTACRSEPRPPPPQHLRAAEARQLTGVHLSPSFRAQWSGPDAVTVVREVDEGETMELIDLASGAIRLSGRMDSTATVLIPADPTAAQIVLVAAGLWDARVYLRPIAGPAWRTGPAVPFPTAAVLDDTGTRLAVLGSGVTVYDLASGHRLSAGDRPAPGPDDDGSFYDSALFTGNTVLTHASAAGHLDKWDVSQSRAVLTRLPCGCRIAYNAIFGAGGRTAGAATMDGTIGLLDTSTGRLVNQVPVTDAKRVLPVAQAVVDDHAVLFQHLAQTAGYSPDPNAGGDVLYSWDATTGAVDRIWQCPHCSITAVRQQAPSRQLLIEATAQPADDPQLWLLRLEWAVRT